MATKGQSLPFRHTGGVESDDEAVPVTDPSDVSCNLFTLRPFRWL